MDAGQWDERYAGQDGQLWSGRPNGALVAEVAGLPPGRALDVGCGEGADAIWLAQRGWRVTGVDISQIALDRAAAAARAAGRGVDIEWVCADVVATPPGHAAYDLVSVQYPALPHSPGDDAIRALLGAVAPGGTLLFVGHADVDSEHARSHGFDPADFIQPPDVAARLGDGWEIEVHEKRPCDIRSIEGSPHTDDIVLRARRRP